jgi:pimeloyl-ACP methyl ester carboxylesterase
VEDVTLKGVYDAWEAYKTTSLPERLQKYHGDKVDTLFKAWTETWTRDDYRSWNIYLLKDITCPLLFIQGEKMSMVLWIRWRKPLPRLAAQEIYYSGCRAYTP